MTEIKVKQLVPVHAHIRENPNRALVSRILRSEECSATAVLCVFVREFSLNATDWSPHVVIKSMEHTFGEIPERTFNKLFAAINVLTTDVFYTILGKFVTITNAISTGTINEDVADLQDVCLAIAEANLIDPIEEPLQDVMSGEILTYIKMLIKNSGLTQPPDTLKFFGLDLDIGADVLSSWSDDPELYHAFVKIHEERRNEYDKIVAKRLNEIQVQLAQLGFDIDVNEELLRIKRKRKPREMTLDDLVDALY